MYYVIQYASNTCVCVVHIIVNACKLIIYVFLSLPPSLFWALTLSLYCLFYVLYLSLPSLPSHRLRKLQVSSDSCVSDLNSQLQLKVFELERVGLLYDETVKSLKKSDKEKDQMRRQLDVSRITTRVYVSFLFLLSLQFKLI